ncbi:MAG: SgcJ/EcaC family oxidoreductase [Bacteroidota bacterium]|nr:SgcJ/EcaC family oxidoreductase [Bacteroidota bacterium]MDO9613311.1 SgcJ/EcaC family oxidoreductase [Bacteroidota bacterium]
MIRINYSGIGAVCVALSLFAVGCSSPAPKVAETPVQVVAEPDMAAIKAEIQALESSWAAADNARDATAIAAFYADDAVSLSNNKPMLVGKAAIQTDIEADLAKRTQGSTVSYDVLDVFGNENHVTEVGKATITDASGKVISTGKYMAVWEKRNGKYICIRDIYNDDVKKK